MRMSNNTWLDMKNLPSLNGSKSQSKFHRMKVKNKKIRENDCVNANVKHHLLLDLMEKYGISLRTMQLRPCLETDEVYPVLSKSKRFRDKNTNEFTMATSIANNQCIIGWIDLNRPLHGGALPAFWTDKFERITISRKCRLQLQAYGRR